MRFECPDSKPVTKTTGGASENDCFTCNERNDNTTNPKYDILHDDCVSCYEYDSEYPDYWAGAMKYCQDKGLRVPSLDELHSIMNVVYGTSNTCAAACKNANSLYVGAQTGLCSYYSLTASNKSLRNFLGSNSTTTTAPSSFSLWSSSEVANNGNGAHLRNFNNYNSTFNSLYRVFKDARAVCLK